MNNWKKKKEGSLATNSAEADPETNGSRLDIIRCWVILRIAPNIDRIWVLIYPNIVDGHDGWEDQVQEVDVPES